MVRSDGSERVQVMGLPFPPLVKVGTQITVPGAHRQSVVICAVATTIGPF
jgi:hypothetical protein